MGLLDWLQRFRPRGARQLEPLLAALAAGGGPDARRRFFAALARSRLIVPSPGLEGTGLPMGTGGTAPANVTINMIATEAPDGSRALVVFTSEDAVRAWRPVGCPYVELRMPDLVALAVRSQVESIVLNPNGPVGGYISPAELNALAEGSDPVDLAGKKALPNGSVRVRPTSTQISAEILQTITSASRELTPILTVWLVELTVGNAAPHDALVVEHDPAADPDTFIPALMTQVMRHLGPGQYIDCLPLATGNALLADARGVTPLHSRPTLGP